MKIYDFLDFLSEILKFYFVSISTAIRAGAASVQKASTEFGIPTGENDDFFYV